MRGSASVQRLRAPQTGQRLVLMRGVFMSDVALSVPGGRYNAWRWTAPAARRSGLRGFTTSPMLARGPVLRHEPVRERPTTARRKGAVAVSMQSTRHRVSCLSQKPLTATTACQRWVSSTTTRCPARTAEPGCTRTSLTMPAWVATSGISIFIDSRITSVSPASTR